MNTKRELTTNDLSELLELYTYLHTEDDSNPNKETIESLWASIQANPDLIYFGIFQGRLVSSCTLSIIPNLTRGCRPYALIENVITHPDYRRKGYGHQVIQSALEASQARNCYKVMLLTGRLDENTFRFYENAGFDRHSKQAFIKKLEQPQTRL